ncbi:MAG TPA: M2 family metallopeptidase [Mesorhizobium sp.]|jgi:peptidyl-dipeptidase A|uniref:M2 family metallopeptidase n=1 Tax=Mesorhizobium sp. TaxID=1871066 RepID=UPI002DDCF38C|nr:M2 family metallopeptidase [Mesorhizobium sp.]HEV2502204.1 M2 family metallopeptidase [Mesorhizobium sp.]
MRCTLLATATVVGLLLQAPAFAQSASPTVEDTKKFLKDAEAALNAESVRVNRIQWVNSTFLTEDTDALAAEAGARQTELSVRLALEAAKFDKVEGLGDEVKRKLNILKGGIVLPAPTTAGAADQLNNISTRLQSAYGKGEGSLRGKPINGSDIEEQMSLNRNPDELKEMWTSWHDKVGAPMRTDYQRLVEISNAGARELGYPNVGAMWRSQYDMPADDVAKLTDKIWADTKPLYDDLHCYVRGKLNEKYGDVVQPKTGPIRADLLGNMWAQEWTGIYDIVAPAGAGDIGYDPTELLKSAGYDDRKMVETGEAFFTSLGFDKLPDTFWKRSMFVKPADRDVVCHASAWDIDNQDDVRIKMCIKVNGQDFVTVHHELGHNFYQRAYKAQDFLHMNGANDGFHEAVGDTIALSITPEYLVQIGLLPKDKVPSSDKDIGLLLRQAMDKIAFMPFGLLVDKWRWGVFDGSVKPEGYNAAWNDLRLKYQGIQPPVERSEASFDPGAKYHIPATTPYLRYFLANVLQFQFYRAACEQSGWKGPLHRCSFYNNKEVGKKFNAMLEMGASKPWPDALEAFTGQREISGDAIIAYFAPLQTWLKEQNRGKSCGW